MPQQSSERQSSIMEHLVSNFTLNSWRRVISVVNVINRLVIVGDKNQNGLNYHMNSKKIVLDKNIPLCHAASNYCTEFILGMHIVRCEGFRVCFFLLSGS